MRAIKRVRYGEKERAQLEKMVEAAKQAEVEQEAESVMAGLKLIQMKQTASSNQGLLNPNNK